MATISSVAKAAGVSVATVSNYINKTKPVSDKCAEKIEKAIASQGYIPNRLAGNLKSGDAKSIGVILPNISDSYYVQIFEGIESQLSELGFSVSLKISKDLKELEQKYLINLLEYRAAGIIDVCAAPRDGQFFYDNIIKNKIPFVHIDRKIEGISADFLGFDNKKTMKSLVKHFAREGRQNIVLIAGPYEYSCEMDAVSGFYEAVEEENVAKSNVLHTFLSKEAAFRTAVQYLPKEKPDVVITTSKLVLSGVTEGLALFGLYSPKDYAIAALSEDTWNTFCNSQTEIASSRQAIYLGKEAALSLIRQLENRACPPQIKIFEDRLDIKDRKALKLDGRGKTLSLLMLDTLQVQLYEGLFSHFEGRTGISINIKKTPHRELLSAIYTDREADVYMFDIPWLYTLANEGKLSDISEEIKVDESIYLQDCLKWFGKYEGRYYGLPFMYAPQILFYRKDLFCDQDIKNEYRKFCGEKLGLPRTWDEFNQIARFFTENAKAPVKYGTAVSAAYVECIVPEIYMRMRAYGGEVFNESFKVTLYSEGTLKAYKNFAGLYQTCSPDCAKFDDNAVVDEFLKGNIAMLVTYPSFIPNINDLQRSCLTGNVGFANIPGKCPVLGGWSLGVSAHSKNKKEACRFIEWACGEELAKYKTLMSGQSSVLDVFDNNELISLYPWLPLYKNVYEMSEPVVPPHKAGKEIIGQEKIDKIVSAGIYSILKGESSVESAVYKSHTELKKLFEKYSY